MTKTALILVDLQNDFMPGGALAVADGDATVRVANALMPDYDLVIATQDWHPADHMSFAANHPANGPGELVQLDGLDQVLWPVHCVQGTAGASFHSALNVAGIHEVIRKGSDRRVDSYSGFFDNGKRKSTGLSDLARSHGIETVHVMGLATDYCVKFTALDALHEGFDVRLIVAGCRGVNLAPGDAQRAVDDMLEAGVKELHVNE